MIISYIMSLKKKNNIGSYVIFRGILIFSANQRLFELYQICLEQEKSPSINFMKSNIQH